MLNPVSLKGVGIASMEIGNGDAGTWAQQIL
jgi:hypothetical protein